MKTLEYDVDPNYEEKSDWTFHDWLSESNGIAEVVSVLKKYNSNYDIINDFPSADPIVTFISTDKDHLDGYPKGMYVIDYFDYAEDAKEAQEWIDEMSNMELITYVEEPDSNKGFWDSPNTVYHATTDEYRDSILENGLSPMNRTRGISNRDIGDAIFTTSDIDKLGHYGNVAFEIDTLAMKADECMPKASKETPFEEDDMRQMLAGKIGFIYSYEPHDYSSEGLFNNTVVFYGSIPPKYLTEL